MDRRVTRGLGGQRPAAFPVLPAAAEWEVAVCPAPGALDLAARSPRVAPPARGERPASWVRAVLPAAAGAESKGQGPEDPIREGLLQAVGAPVEEVARRELGTPVPGEDPITATCQRR